MAKAIIVYESKYGNTKLVAEAIAQGMNQEYYRKRHPRLGSSW